MLVIDATPGGYLFHVECDGERCALMTGVAMGPSVPALSKDDAAAVAQAVTASGFRPFERDGLGGLHLCFACDAGAR